MLVYVRKRVKGYYWVLLCAALSACKSYQELQVDALKPADMSLKNNAKIVFVDRGIVHQRDRNQAVILKKTLNMERNDLVDYFYDGLRDGLNWGEKRIVLEKTYGVKDTVVENGYEVPRLTMEEIIDLTKRGVPEYLLAVEYCRFYSRSDSTISFRDNMLLRLYDIRNGEVLDSLTSEQLDVRTQLNPHNLFASIREYMYQKGWSYAEHIVPVWIPSRRRIYVNNHVLKSGYYFLKADDVEQAGMVWSAALKQKPETALKAAINLAWLYEREGDFEGAIQLLESTLKRFQDKQFSRELAFYLRDLVKKLQQRIEDTAKLEEQLNF